MYICQSANLESHSWETTKFLLKALPAFVLDLLAESAMFSNIAVRRKVTSASITTLVFAMLLFWITSFIIQSIWTH